MNLTPSQQRAIAARGNVVVFAGAGTGKTRTLVERCLDCLVRESPPAGMDEILMVTFTEAAAAEMRQRIRARLEHEIRARPGEAGWLEQVALFDTAHIGTLHSFCFELVRQHFYQLELDPQLTVLGGEEAALLASEALSNVLQAHYGGRTDQAAAVQKLIQIQGEGRDQWVRGLVLRLHHYSQTLPDPAGWFASEAARFENAEPEVWRGWLAEALADWPRNWKPFLELRAAQNDIARACLAKLAAWGPDTGPAAAAEHLREILNWRDHPPKGKKGAWVEPLKPFFQEVDFLLSVGEPGVAGGPLAQDWKWVREHARTLLFLVAAFQQEFGHAKRELGVVDFQDLEQLALRLLWDPATGQRTAIAREWGRKLRFVFVDEYQDINAVQDRIVEALSREGSKANRFLVGDVKQSIYRFRLANPRIFQGYVANWRGEAGEVIPLRDNFRSREGILKFVNAFFGSLMSPELGGVTYDAESELHFGAAEERGSLAASGPPRVELHLRRKGGGNIEPEPEQEADLITRLAELGDAEKEARLVALRLLELRAQRHEVWDEESETFRPVDWADMAVLVRAPSNKAEAYAKEFSRLNIPLQVIRGGFYESSEISDLVNLLKLLDNPLQDIPAAAVLRSPLVGFTLNELASLRLAVRRGALFAALVSWVEAGPKTEASAVGASAEARARGALFLKRYAGWRQLARQASLSRCLQAVLTETHYDSWLLTQPRGQERQANVRRFLRLAEKFDLLQKQGLFRFLVFVEAQQSVEAEPEAGPIAVENSVRLMSIHRSKGLEFPLVVVADLGKAFNETDLNADVILDEQYGLCPQVTVPETGRRFPSLPYWLARRRQRQEMLGEELRLLYVAMTRAKDTLLLVASAPEKRLEEQWRGDANQAQPRDARNYADWLAQWCVRDGGLGSGPAGTTKLWSWRIHDDRELVSASRETPVEAGMGDSASRPELDWAELRSRLMWQYPHAAQTEQPAKLSVSALRRRASESDEESSDADLTEPGAKVRRRRFPSSESDSAEAVGRAHHRFLELVSLSVAPTAEVMREEAQRLIGQSLLSKEEASHLDYEGLSAFWQSDLGTEVRRNASCVRRELAFTARFSAADIAAAGWGNAWRQGEDFVVVQGIADLVLILPRELRLIDFKTDRITSEGLGQKLRHYAPQLEWYARALAKIYGRPVTASWLYFLSLHQAIQVSLAESPPAIEQ